MADHVRWGILGAAHFAQEHMAPAIQLARGGRLAALATRHADKAAAFSALAPGLAVHESYDALLDSSEVDAVYIPLPNTMHVEWTLKALEAGKHVLCEKPLAMRADGFDPVIARRDATGLLASEAYMIVHHPQWQKVKSLLEEGAIGTLKQIDTVFSYHNGDDPGNIRNTPETGGGSLPDIGVYTMGSARFVTGEEPEAIRFVDITRENGVDVWAEVVADFPSFRFHGITSMRMQPRQEVTVQGDAGLIRVSAPFNPGVFGVARVELHRGDAPAQAWEWPRANHYVLQVEAFNRAVMDGETWPCPLEFSKGTQAMIDMVFDAE